MAILLNLVKSPSRISKNDLSQLQRRTDLEAKRTGHEQNSKKKNIIITWLNLHSHGETATTIVKHAQLRIDQSWGTPVYHLECHHAFKLCQTSETRRLRRNQIEVFKILNGYENIYRNMFFSLKKDSRTRGHEVKLVKDQCRLDIRKHSFSQRTVNEWNTLSTDCVTASSVNMFKNKVDTYLRRAGYK